MMAKDSTFSSSPEASRRVLLRAGLGGSLLASLAGLGACGSSKPPKPELPAVSGNRLGAVWRFKTSGAGFGFSPAFAAGSVFAAGRDGVVTRREAASGKLQWSINAGAELIAGVGSDGDAVVVAARDGRLLAFDSDGKAKWTHVIGTEAGSVPVVGVGMVIVRTSDNKTIGIDSSTGRRRWIYARQNAPVIVRQTSLVAIDGASTFVGLPAGRMVALSLQSGAVRWEVPVSNPKGSTEIERINDVLGSPLVSGREVCAASYQGRVGCYEASTGRPIWSREWQAVGGVELDGRNLYACDSRGFVVCLSRSGGGNPVWTQEALKSRELSGPVVLGSVVLVGDQSGLIHAMNASDGALAGRIATDGTAIVGAGVNAGGVAVFQTSGGEVIAVSAS